MQALTFVPAEETELVEMYKRWTIAYSKTLMCHLRENAELELVLKVPFAACRTLWMFDVAVHAICE